MPLLPDPRALGRRLAGLAAVLFLAASLGGCIGSNANESAAPAVRRVGLMHVGTDHVPPSLDTLTARLEELGWTEGENVRLIWRNLEPEAAERQAEEFVRERVDVIVAFEDSSIRAAQAATSGGTALTRTRHRIPIVFLHPTDPVRDGLVKSLSHPGGNLTGVFGPRDVVAKQLELYERLVPGLHRVLTLIDPQDPNTKRLLPQYVAAAAHLPRRLELDIRKASNAQDLKGIFRSLRPGEVDAAFLLSTSLRLNFSALTIGLSRQAEIPVQAHRKEWVEKGALFSFGADLAPIGRAGSRFVDEILRGTAPADLSVEEVPAVELAINLKTADRLGIKLPQEMIIQADKVHR
jgi:putative tryptophan/tyrosine transport system substrate-binding protein